MNGRVLLLAAALVLLLAVGVAAQGDTGTRRQGDIETAASTTYSLDWWTVDGGGASYNATGSYILGGTAGQPDAAVPRSGGSDPVYTLRAGFWQPSCVAAAVVTTITRALGDPNTVTLSWTHNEANQTYQMHRATTPYFTPVAGTLQETVTAGPWSDDRNRDRGPEHKLLLPGARHVRRGVRRPLEGWAAGGVRLPAGAGKLTSQGSGRKRRLPRS